MVGGVRSVMLSTLVAVALLNAVMAPELARFTIPPALLVIPEMVPVPLRFSVPVLVKFAREVEMGPAPVFVVVPALASVVIETIPPRFSVPPAPLVNVPVPERVFPTVRVPLLVWVPAIVTLAMAVIVEPVITLPDPPNVWMDVSDVTNVLALFVKLPKKS